MILKKAAPLLEATGNDELLSEIRDAEEFRSRFPNLSKRRKGLLSRFFPFLLVVLFIGFGVGGVSAADDPEVKITKPQALHLGNGSKFMLFGQQVYTVFDDSLNTEEQHGNALGIENKEKVVPFTLKDDSDVKTRTKPKMFHLGNGSKYMLYAADRKPSTDGGSDKYQFYGMVDASSLGAAPRYSGVEKKMKESPIKKVEFETLKGLILLAEHLGNG